MHRVFAGGEQAEAESGQSIGFRKCARNDYIWNAAYEIEHGVTVEMEVGFVDQDHGVWSGVDYFQKCIAADGLSGWTVGIGDGDHSCCRRDAGKEAVERE